MKSNQTDAARTESERRQALSRRNFLRGVGACVALPAFHSLLPRTTFGAEALGDAAAALAGGASVAAPVRMAFVTFPNGANQYNWWPTGDGKDFKLNTTMQALAGVKDKIQVISGLAQHNADPGDDGAGDHARANATLLTGMRAKKTAGADIHLGKSIDQVAAQHVGHLTRFPSLELSCDPNRQSAGCDSGYACAYQFNVSWRSDDTPMTPEANPRLVFERLFGGGPRGQRQDAYRIRQQTQRSILDFILADARALQKKLGDKEERKLDEYLSSIREIEQRIQHAEGFGAVPDPSIDTPSGVPSEVGDHMDLMYDLMVLAFQTDSTRVATMMLGHDGDNRPYPQLGVADGHHNISHHQEKADLLDKIGRIDQHHVQHFARFLEKLNAVKDTDGKSLLDNSMIVYAGGNSDGNRHTHTNLPVIMAGAASGALDTGRYLVVPEVPMCNLFLDMLDRMGIDGVERFGDSTGRKVIA